MNTLQTRQNKSCNRLRDCARFQKPATLRDNDRKFCEYAIKLLDCATKLPDMLWLLLMDFDQGCVIALENCVIKLEIL
jgi:hypothetical protein